MKSTVKEDKGRRSRRVPIMRLLAFALVLVAGASALKPGQTAASGVPGPPGVRQRKVAPDHIEPEPRSATDQLEADQNLREGERGREPDHPDEAQRFRRLQLQDEKGFIPADGIEKARRHVQIMKAAQQKRFASRRGFMNLAAGIKPDSWESMGPDNVGGRIRSIVIDPTNADRMWAGSVAGGIWQTVDGGNHWSEVRGFSANLAVSAMVINPANPQILYAGTGELFVGDGLRGKGIFQSINGGQDWHPLTGTEPAACPDTRTIWDCDWLYVNRLAISRDGKSILAATNKDLWWSPNEGKTWNRGQGFQGPFYDVDFDPLNSQNAVASANGFAAYSTSGGRAWKAAQFSTDGGRTFTNIDGRVELAYAPSNPAIVYASVDQNFGEIYRSTDGGRSYLRVNTGTRFFISLLPCRVSNTSQGQGDNIIWVNPLDPGFIIVGGVNLWRSTNGGATFDPISQWCSDASAHADHHVIVAHPRFDNRTNLTAFFGNDGGVYRADNIRTVAQTSGWTALNRGLAITQFYTAAVNTNGVFIGGTQDNGTLMLTGGPNPGSTTPAASRSWKTLEYGDGGYCAADPTDPNYFYGEIDYLKIFRSSNGGAYPPEYIYQGIPDAGNWDRANFLAPFVLDPKSPNVMLAGGITLWRSPNVKDLTPQWADIKEPTADRSPISAIAISPGSSDVICVGHNNGDIYLTTNWAKDGGHWPKIDDSGPNPLPNRLVTRLVIDSTRNPNWVYATFGGFSGDNVYRFDGQTWVDITGTGATGLPDVPVRSLVFHPDSPNFLYVGTELGIFSSEDGGKTWDLSQNGPANVSVDDLFWYKPMGASPLELIAVTHGRGLYHTPIAATDVIHLSPARLRRGRDRTLKPARPQSP